MAYVNTFAGRSGALIQVDEIQSEFQSIEAALDSVAANVATALRGQSGDTFAITPSSSDAVMFDASGDIKSARIENSFHQDALVSSTDASRVWSPACSIDCAYFSWTGSGTSKVVMDFNNSPILGSPINISNILDPFTLSGSQTQFFVNDNAGKYLVAFSGGGTSIVNTSPESAYVKLVKTGVDTGIRSEDFGRNANGFYGYPHFMGVVDLADGDYLEFIVVHTGAGSMAEPKIRMVRLHT